MPWSISHAAEEVNKPPQQTVGEDVIGTPKPAESRYEYCFSGVLLPNKDNFYTVRDGLLSEYQIEPFKRVRSVELEWGRLRDSGQTSCRIRTTGDHSKVVIYNDKILLLLDAKTGRLINSRPFPEGMTVYAAQTEGNRIFMLVDPDGYPLDSAGYQLQVWDLDSLEQEKAIEMESVVKTFRPDGEPPRMEVDGGRVYLFSGKHFLILNGKDMRLDLVSLMLGNVWGKVWVSSDFDGFYYRHSAIIRDQLSGEEVWLSIPEGEAALFCPATNEVRRVQRLDDIDLNGKGYRPVATGGDFSVNNGFWMVDKARRIFKRNDYVMYRFDQYELGAGIMMKYVIKSGVKSNLVGVSVTPGARRYLSMEIEGGKVVPINDATFKFFQSSSLGGLP